MAAGLAPIAWVNLCQGEIYSTVCLLTVGFCEASSAVRMRASVCFQTSLSARFKGQRNIERDFDDDD